MANWRGPQNKDHSRSWHFWSRCGIWLILDFLSLLLRSRHRLIPNPLLDEITRMVGPAFQIQLAAVLLSLFGGFELSGNGIFPEPADFLWLFGQNPERSFIGHSRLLSFL